MEDLKMKIGIILVKIREHHNLSRRQVAELANVSKSIVNKIENENYRPGEKILYKIADALNVDECDLLDERLPDLAHIDNVDRVTEDSRISCAELWDKEYNWAMEMQEKCRVWEIRSIRRKKGK